MREPDIVIEAKKLEADGLLHDDAYRLVELRRLRDKDLKNENKNLIFLSKKEKVELAEREAAYEELLQKK